MHLMSLAGLLFAVIRWKRHPKVSLLTVAALLLLLIQSLTFGTIYYYLPELLRQGFTYGTLNSLYLLVEVCRDIVYSIIVVLLVSAAFSGRSPTESTSPLKPAEFS